MAGNDAVLELVRRLFAAFLTQDREALDAILSEDFTFNGPRDDHINKQDRQQSKSSPASSSLYLPAS